MEKLDIIILKALIRSNHIYEHMDIFDVNNKFASIYPFTTENIKGYLDCFDVENKDVLTVGASGDQTLNLLFRDVKSVDYFDMNPFTELYFNLKCAAIKILSLDEFLEFFCFDAFPSTFKKNKNAFNINVYYKISPYLDDNTRKFWDSLYLKQSGFEIRKSMLFSNDEEPFRVLPKVNDYLNEDAFNRLKVELDKKAKPKFFETNVTKLSSKLIKKYDYILLSNIAQYLDYIYDKDELVSFKRLIKSLSNELNPNGKIMLAYLYDTKMDSIWNENYANIYNLKKVMEIFADENLELLNFPAITDLKWQYQTDKKDAALVYTKKN